MQKKFILVNNELGYPIYPDASVSPNAKAEATDNRKDTYEYVHGEDAPETKRKFWSAAIGINFEIQPA